MKKNLIITGISGVLFLTLAIMLGMYDVAAIGPQGTEIGFSTINGSVRDAIGLNLFWYDLTGLLGTLGLGVCAVFGLVGVVQMIRRRSLLKVDHQILALGVFYVVVIGCYVLFELVVINYRPVILPGDTMVEASFPSSHTMLICCAMGSTIMALKHYIKSDTLRLCLQAGCAVLAAVVVIGRMLSGVHWFTDILGGVLLSFTLLGLLGLALELLDWVRSKE